MALDPIDHIEPTSASPMATWQPLLQALITYRWWMLAFVTLSGIIAWVATLPPFMEQEFKSTAIIVVPNLRNAKSLTFLKEEFSGYGVAARSEIKQVVAALTSDDAFNHLVNRFKLVRHYGLEELRNESQQEKRLRQKYDKKVQIRVVKHATIQIEVFDTNPFVAAAMANALVRYGHSFVESISRREKGVDELYNSIEKLASQRYVAQDTAEYYREKLKIYRLDNLGEALAREIGISVFQKPEFAQNYDQLIRAEDRVKHLEYHLAKMRSEYSYRKENLRVYPSLINVAGDGIVSFIIERPNRWLIVSLSVVGALCFAFTLLIFLVYIRPQMNSYGILRLTTNHRPT
jgi:hypothetical protein